MNRIRQHVHGWPEENTNTRLGKTRQTLQSLQRDCGDPQYTYCR